MHDYSIVARVREEVSEFRPAGPIVGSTTDITDAIIEIATWFYLQGWSQVRIAKTLDLDPSTVSRYLKRAREDGIVRIEIHRPARFEVDLGLAVAERYGISRAIIVRGEDEPLERTATAAAEHLDGILHSGDRLGVSWGWTLASVVRRLRPGSVSSLRIAQLAGGVDESAPGIQGHDLVRSLGGLYPHGQVRYLHAPAIVDSILIADAVMSDRSIRSALHAAAASEIALVGVGGLDESATLVRGGHVSPSDRKRLLRLGAVGNMNTRFFGADGQPVGDLDRRTIAIDWDQLRRIPTVIAVAAGDAKAGAIAGALRTGCVDVLVTDDAVARRLLDTPGTNSPDAAPFRMARSGR